MCSIIPLELISTMMYMGEKIKQCASFFYVLFPKKALWSNYVGLHATMCPCAYMHIQLYSMQYVAKYYILGHNKKLSGHHQLLNQITTEDTLYGLITYLTKKKVHLKNQYTRRFRTFSNSNQMALVCHIIVEEFEPIHYNVV